MQKREICLYLYMFKMAGRIRVNWTIDTHAYNLLLKINPKSMSALVSKLIIDKFQNPIKKLEADNRELARKINENQEKIRALLEDRKNLMD